jgi:hypothetical protein
MEPSQEAVKQMALGACDGIVLGAIEANALGACVGACIGPELGACEGKMRWEQNPVSLRAHQPALSCSDTHQSAHTRHVPRCLSRCSSRRPSAG